MLLNVIVSLSHDDINTAVSVWLQPVRHSHNVRWTVINIAIIRVKVININSVIRWWDDDDDDVICIRNVYEWTHLILCIISLLPSTAERKPPSKSANHLGPGQPASIYCQPPSLNQRPILQQGALHYVCPDAVSTLARLLHLPSVRLQTWPAHFHFSMLILSAMSITLVLWRMTLLRILSTRKTPSIALSIARWATLNLWTRPMVSVHVSAP